MEENIKQILAAVVSIKKYKKHIIVAIDGRCASGKTSLAEALKKRTDCQIIHMDDFFLRPGQISEERLSTPGENVDWERLQEEVLIPLTNGNSFSYKPYDCRSQTFKQKVYGQPSALTILEGAYSCNSHLWDYADLHVFLNIRRQEQLRRIEKRNGIQIAEIFKTKWIPLEENYFSTFDIQNKCELRLNGEGEAQ